MGTDQATREMKQCRFCYEPMDVRANVCPHCQRRTVGSAVRRELLRLALSGLVLVIALPLMFKLIVFECGQIGKHMFDGIKLSAHAQPAHQAKPKAH